MPIDPVTYQPETQKRINVLTHQNMELTLEVERLREDLYREQEARQAACRVVDSLMSTIQNLL